MTALPVKIIFKLKRKNLINKNFYLKIIKYFFKLINVAKDII